MRDVYQLYAKHHTEFTADEIYIFSKELDTVIYFDALSEVSVRVSHDLFVSKKRINFDVNSVDKVIESFMSKDYIRIREIDSFLAFPSVGYEWNEYMLESFLISYSKKFALLNNGQSLHNVAGAIVKKDGKIKEFEDACAAVLSESRIELKKSDALIEKIHTMTSAGQVEKLRRNNYVVNRIKPDNEQIYYIIDTINEAINSGKQISFQYYDYTGLKKEVLKNKGEVYKLSLYKLLWCGDYYYVLGYSEKQRKVINFRVDRIVLRPDILAKDIIPMPDDFDIENYTKEVFFMFSGEKVLVDLRCDNSLMKTMVNRFGEDVTTLAYDMTSFRVQTEVSASPTFFGWVFGFNGKVQILAPESLKEQYRQMLTKATEDMKENE